MQRNYYLLLRRIKLTTVAAMFRQGGSPTLRSKADSVPRSAPLYSPTSTSVHAQQPCGVGARPLPPASPYRCSLCTSFRTHSPACASSCRSHTFLQLQTQERCDCTRCARRRISARSLPSRHDAGPAAEDVLLSASGFPAAPGPEGLLLPCEQTAPSQLGWSATRDTGVDGTPLVAFGAGTGVVMDRASSEQRRTPTVDDSKGRKGVDGRGRGSGGHEAGVSSSGAGGGSGGGGGGGSDGEGPEADRGAADAYAQYGTVVRVLRADLPEVGARCGCKTWAHGQMCRRVCKARLG